MRDTFRTYSKSPDGIFGVATTFQSQETGDIETSREAKTSSLYYVPVAEGTGLARLGVLKAKFNSYSDSGFNPENLEYLVPRSNFSQFLQILKSKKNEAGHDIFVINKFQVLKDQEQEYVAVSIRSFSKTANLAFETAVRGRQASQILEIQSAQPIEFTNPETAGTEVGDDIESPATPVPTPNPAPGIDFGNLPPEILASLQALLEKR